MSRRLAGLLGIASAWLALSAPAAAADEPPERADVVAVRVDGRPGSYRFAVTLRSPDRDCSRYASWWEIVREDGSLVYRRVLMHSHPDEQPFTRGGGPVRVQPDETLIVRAHLHPAGYGGVAFRGSVSAGFARWDDAPDDFAGDLAQSPPLPSECWR